MMKPEKISPLKILVVDDTPTNVLVVKVASNMPAIQ
jgi:hypothetical protein